MQEEELSKMIFNNVVKSMFEYGEITEKDFDDKNIILDKIKKVISQKKIEITIDHRDGIYKQALLFHEVEDYNNSILFFSIYFEHMLNNFIDFNLRAKGKNPDTIKNTIRNSNIDSKCSWILDLLDLPKIPDKHKKIIKKVADMRNTYVHYKWLPDKDNDKIPDLDKDKQEANKLFECIKSTVMYLKKYETKLKYKGKKDTFIKKMEETFYQ